MDDEKPISGMIAHVDCGKSAMTQAMMRVLATERLDPDTLYPLYSGVDQSRAFKRGETTHKLPSDMNRHERRRVMKLERLRKSAHPANGKD